MPIQTLESLNSLQTKSASFYSSLPSASIKISCVCQCFTQQRKCILHTIQIQKKWQSTGRLFTKLWSGLCTFENKDWYLTVIQNRRSVCSFAIIYKNQTKFQLQHNFFTIGQTQELNSADMIFFQYLRFNKLLASSNVILMMLFSVILILVRLKCGTYAFNSLFFVCFKF